MLARLSSSIVYLQDYADFKVFMRGGDPQATVSQGNVIIHLTICWVPATIYSVDYFVEKCIQCI